MIMILRACSLACLCILYFSGDSQDPLISRIHPCFPLCFQKQGRHAGSVSREHANHRRTGASRPAGDRPGQGSLTYTGQRSLTYTGQRIADSEIGQVRKHWEVQIYDRSEVTGQEIGQARSHKSRGRSCHRSLTQRHVRQANTGPEAGHVRCN